MTVPDRYVESDQTRDARALIDAITTAHLARKYDLQVANTPGPLIDYGIVATPGPLIDHGQVEVLDGDFVRLTGFAPESP